MAGVAGGERTPHTRGESGEYADASPSLNLFSLSPPCLSHLARRHVQQLAHALLAPARHVGGGDDVHEGGPELLVREGLPEIGVREGESE